MGPLLLTAYRAAVACLGPFAPLWLAARSRAGKEDPARLGERYGRTTLTRPAGRLVWLHGASVGECGVALQLVEALAAHDPDLRFLLTSGTRTSAEVIARRAPASAVHVYAPLDRGDAVRRFLSHWRPDLGVFIESDMWPNLMLEAEAAHIPLALVNARMSPSSLAQLQRWSRTARRLLKTFALVLAADRRTAQALTPLRTEATPFVGNLKLAAPAPSVDADKRAALQAEIAGRPVWLAASTHAGEDEIALAAHARLRAAHSDALLIIVPRHPERGAAIAALANAPRRALGAPIGDAAVYVADTMGELGLFYAGAGVALIAGSLVANLKGHNPAEAAKLGCAILSGPHVESFAEVFDALTAAHGAIIVRDAEEIARAVQSLWSDAAAREAQTDAARAVLDKSADALSETVRRLRALLPARAEAAHASA